MNLISSSFLRLRTRSESSSSLNSATSGLSSSVFSSPSSPTSTAATSALEDDDFDIIQDLYIRKDAVMEPSTRQAYESVLLPLINQELLHSAYAERYSIKLCSAGFQRSACSPAILISTPTLKVKGRIFAHLSGLTDLIVALKEHNLALHVVVHRIRRSGGRSAQLGDIGKLAYVVPRPGSNALCGSKIVIPNSGRMELSSCTSGPTFIVGGREYGKTALHPWEDTTDAIPDADSESSLFDEEDDATNDGHALSMFPNGTGFLDESDNSSSLFSDFSIDDLTPLTQTHQVASHITNTPPNANERAKSAHHGPSRVNPIYQGPRTDWLLYDAQEAAPDIELRELTKNEVDGYRITKFHQEDPDAKVPVAIADHEAIVHGYILPGAVSFRSGSKAYDMRLVTLDYRLRPGCSGAAVTHQDELCGTIQVISEDVPWAYMMPIKAELKEMEAVCGLPVRLSGSEEAYTVELDSQQSFMPAPADKSVTYSSSDRPSSDAFVVPLDHQINHATEPTLLTCGNGMNTTNHHSAVDSSLAFRQAIHLPLPPALPIEDGPPLPEELHGQPDTPGVTAHDDLWTSSTSSLLHTSRSNIRSHKMGGWKFSSFKEPTLTEDLTEDIPSYQTLSHAWGVDEDEGMFNDLYKADHAMIRFCAEQARKYGLQHFWVDTCCIDKANRTEITEAVTSMLRWYLYTEKVYVYLADVEVIIDNKYNRSEQMWESTFRKSQWFTRGWTLQEILPKSVEFFSRGEWSGNRNTLERVNRNAKQLDFKKLLLYIGKMLQIPGFEENKEDIMNFFRRRLSSPFTEKWPSILDNANDKALLRKRSDSGPESCSTTITPIRGVANFLTGKDVNKLCKMLPNEGVEAFTKALERPGLSVNDTTILNLMEKLGYLPLTITQAALFFNMTQRLVQTYLKLLDQSSKDFGDSSQHLNAQNPLAPSWIISFNHIHYHHPLAAMFFSSMASFRDNNIPETLLQEAGSEINIIHAIAVLTGYPFVRRRAVYGADGQVDAAVLLLESAIEIREQALS